MPKRYGRGKFEPHENYIKYMEEMVKNLAYEDMPNAISEDGRVNWQVSSGKTTSFYDYYNERFEWWVKKADKLEVPGTGNSNDRFSVTARLIHPTGTRPCRLCGQYLHVGYIYVNKTLAKKWNKLVRKDLFNQKQDIRQAAKLLLKKLGKRGFLKAISDIFEHRCKKLGIDLLMKESGIDEFFVKSSYLRSPYLSPGFMSNAPDRLDGFHDYGLCCRKEKDPGRSDENLRSYLHDRRAFQWWTEGDWKTADTLYYSMGSGKCEQCDRRIKKISPHHVGPLSCGFKQLPLFIPLCGPCNSGRNRRMPLEDVQRLVKYETVSDESVASWQVRNYWNQRKGSILNDKESKELSNILRSIEDYYLRVLHRFWKEGNAHFISSFLSPQYAHFDVHFIGLDTRTLKFNSFHKIPKKTKGTMSLAARSVRIAFEELEAYCIKPRSSRKFPKIPTQDWEKQLLEILELAADLRLSPWSEKWMKAVDTSEDMEKRERRISGLLENNYQETINPYNELRKRMFSHFDWIGKHLVRS